MHRERVTHTQKDKNRIYRMKKYTILGLFWSVTHSLCAHIFFFVFFCVLILIFSISRKGVETKIDCNIKREHELINDLLDTDQIPIDQ